MNDKTILLADDDFDLRSLYKMILEKSGFTVITAEDGESALAIALEKKPSAIVIDISMPKKDGVSVCKLIRNDANWGKHVPIVLLTGKEVDEIGIDNILSVEPAFYFIKGGGSADEFADKIQNLFV